MARPSRVLVGVFAAAVVASVAVNGHAQTAPSAIYACVVNDSGTVRIVAPGTACRKNEALITWNLQGPAGNPGMPGAAGAPGGFELVAADGQVLGTFLSSDRDPTFSDISHVLYWSDALQAVRRVRATQRFDGYAQAEYPTLNIRYSGENCSGQAYIPYGAFLNPELVQGYTTAVPPPVYRPKSTTPATVTMASYWDYYHCVADVRTGPMLEVEQIDRPVDQYPSPLSIRPKQ